MSQDKRLFSRNQLFVVQNQDMIATMTDISSDILCRAEARERGGKPKFRFGTIKIECLNYAHRKFQGSTTRSEKTLGRDKIC